MCIRIYILSLDIPIKELTTSTNRYNQDKRERSCQDEPEAEDDEETEDDDQEAEHEEDQADHEDSQDHESAEEQVLRGVWRSDLARYGIHNELNHASFWLSQVTIDEIISHVSVLWI